MNRIPDLNHKRLRHLMEDAIVAGKTNDSDGSLLIAEVCDKLGLTAAEIHALTQDNPCYRVTGEFGAARLHYSP